MELRNLARLAGAEGFAGWPGRGRKEEAKAKVPARGFDWARDGIPDSNFPDEPEFRCSDLRRELAVCAPTREEPASRVLRQIGLIVKPFVGRGLAGRCLRDHANIVFDVKALLPHTVFRLPQPATGRSLSPLSQVMQASCSIRLASF